MVEVIENRRVKEKEEKIRDGEKVKMKENKENEVKMRK